MKEGREKKKEKKKFVKKDLRNQYCSEDLTRTVYPTGVQSGRE
jgi:hypothetical protein